MIPARYHLALATLLLSPLGSAGPLMDYIRSYDLNDYALGLTVSSYESPYSGGDDAVIAYPYLTSFRDSAFTDDWFLISERNVGFRWVNDAGWELGIVGRLQTLGLGNSTAAELHGLDDRNWGVEMAPMIGWRGWPVHINFRTYWEVTGHHDGTTSVLNLSLPRQYDRGYFIPAVEAIYRSDEYTNYYFGVSASEARPDRLEYEAGASTDFAARIRWGYAVSDKWLLSGKIGVEFIDDEITNSPIADKDEIWSASLSLAYNSNVFQPRDSDLGGNIRPKLEFRLSAFADSVDWSVTRDADDGAPGEEIDLDNLLGISDSETVLQIDAIYRINKYHRLEIGYHQISRAGTVTLGDDVLFGTTTFASGTEVTSTFDAELLKLGYGYSLMSDSQKELGVMAGLHMTKSITEIQAPTTGQIERSDFSTPLPVVGVFGSVELGTNSTLGARIQAFALEFDRVEGSMIFLKFEWLRRFGDNVSLGVGYNFYATRLDSTESDGRGTLETRQHGPVVFISANF